MISTKPIPLWTQFWLVRSRPSVGRDERNCIGNVKKSSEDWDYGKAGSNCPCPLSLFPFLFFLFFFNLAWSLACSSSLTTVATKNLTRKKEREKKKKIGLSIAFQLEFNHLLSNVLLFMSGLIQMWKGLGNSCITSTSHDQVCLFDCFTSSFIWVHDFWQTAEYYWLNNLFALHWWKWRLKIIKSIKIKFLNFCNDLSMLVQNLYSYYKLMFPKECFLLLLLFFVFVFFFCFQISNSLLNSSQPYVLLELYYFRWAGQYIAPLFLQQCRDLILILIAK